MHLAQRAVVVGDVLEHVRGHDRVDRAVVERQRETSASSSGASGTSACARRRPCGDEVDADSVRGRTAPAAGPRSR